MMGTATRAVEFFQPPGLWRRRLVVEDRTPEEPGGVPILANQFGDLVHLVVEIAWGADLTANPASWVWTDVTTDVQIEGGKKVSITVGRADEASAAQPAHATMVLDNRRNTYSRSPLSQNWPNVRKNTPVR